ncbi:SPW repeat protein [Thermobifida halotolerans]|uniref:SPW repeat protein n=1 Tax=Thermobifida halotolerans TaxID=483545 RepID=A0A399G203_9ACTN|nr:SPW repeat protein [Thermobifida halotolerans]UOE19598.1 SPW repeat protein [Thermobifida halotolerans]
MRGRWDDWVALTAGVVASVSWVWHGLFGVGMVALFLVGVTTVFTAVISITRPGLIVSELILVVLGVLLFLTPWLVGFAGEPAAAWTAWILGAVIAAMGAVGVPRSGKSRRGLRPHGPDGSETRSPTTHSYR